jgi:hypothetical protein
MNNVITKDNSVEKSSKKDNINISLGKIYLFLLIFSASLIYFYSVNKDDYLSVLIPYRVLWQIAIIFIGISMLRVKNTAAFSVGFFITSLAVGLTITSTFVYSYNILDNTYTKIVPVFDASVISSDINFISTQAKIKSGEINLFKSDLSSNYDTLISSNYRDENKIENIKLEQNLFPPGFGAYTKNSDIVFPTNIPISFNINANFSDIEFDLSNLKFKSGSIKTNSSTLNMVIKDINLEEDAVLDVNANLSTLNIIVSKDIPITISNSSRLSQNEFIGISENSNDSNFYQNLTQYDSLESELSQKEIKKLIINLSSTLSQVKVTQN